MYTHKHTHSQTNREEPIVRIGSLLEVIDKLPLNVLSAPPIGNNPHPHKHTPNVLYAKC